MSQVYAPSNYDDYCCLKPPLLLWIAVLYLSRGFVLPVFVGFAHFANVDGMFATALRGSWSFELMIPGLPSIAVLFALIRRVPTASGGARGLWAHGRMLLAASAVIDLMWLVISELRLPSVGDGLPLVLAGFVTDAYFLLYILVAARVRDSFASFPARLDALRE